MIWDWNPKPKSIFGGHLNIRSQLPKRDQIRNPLIYSNFLALSESWLNSNIVTELQEIPGYDCYCKDRCSGKDGGVIMYLKDNIKNCQMELEPNWNAWLYILLSHPKCP